MFMLKVCTLCQTAVANQEALDKHKAEAHRKCPHCPFFVAQHTDIDIHMEKHLRARHAAKAMCLACGFYNLDQG